MIDVIQERENKFAENNYFGSNVPYDIKGGGMKILISAPNSVRTVRGEKLRPPEHFTGTIAEYLATAADSYSMVRIGWHSVEEMKPYNEALEEVVLTHKLKLIIDLHGISKECDAPLDIVYSNHVDDNIKDVVREFLKEYEYEYTEGKYLDIDADYKVCNHIDKKCSIPCIKFGLREDIRNPYLYGEEVMKFLRFASACINSISQYYY